VLKNENINCRFDVENMSSTSSVVSFDSTVIYHLHRFGIKTTILN